MNEYFMHSSDDGLAMGGGRFVPTYRRILFTQQGDTLGSGSILSSTMAHPRHV